MIKKTYKHIYSVVNTSSIWEKKPSKIMIHNENAQKTRTLYSIIIWTKKNLFCFVFSQCYSLFVPLTDLWFATIAHKPILMTSSFTCTITTGCSMNALRINRGHFWIRISSISIETCIQIIQLFTKKEFVGLFLHYLVLLVRTLQFKKRKNQSMELLRNKWWDK